jgi:uncharacterized membrane protein
MNTKTTLGILLTMLGIVGVVYPVSVLTSTKEHDSQMLIIYAVVGIIAFLSGIGVIRKTEDA